MLLDHALVDLRVVNYQTQRGYALRFHQSTRDFDDFGKVCRVIDHQDAMKRAGADVKASEGRITKLIFVHRADMRAQ